MPTRRRMDVKDPHIGFQFTVEIGGMDVAYFTEVTGLQAEIEVFEYQEGGENSYTHKLPVRAKFSNITLKRGIILDDNRLWDWFKNATQGKIERQSISIRMLLRDYSEARRWNVLDAYPVKWNLPSYKTTDNTVAVETLELAHRGFSADDS